jgi:hypothetical protein
MRAITMLLVAVLVSGLIPGPHPAVAEDDLQIALAAEAAAETSRLQRLSSPAASAATLPTATAAEPAFWPSAAAAANPVATQGPADELVPAAGLIPAAGLSQALPPDAAPRPATAAHSTRPLAGIGPVAFGSGGQGPAAGGGLAHLMTAGDMIGFSRDLGDGVQAITLINASQRWMAVYHIDSSGQIRLTSSRPLEADFTIQFNASSPLPEEIRRLQGK